MFTSELFTAAWATTKSELEVSAAMDYISSISQNDDLNKWKRVCKWQTMSFMIESTTKSKTYICTISTLASGASQRVPVQAGLGDSEK